MWIIVTIVALLYFMPSVVAAGRGHKNTAAIVILNLFLGWTGLGFPLWVARGVAVPHLATAPLRPRSDFCSGVMLAATLKAPFARLGAFFAVAIASIQFVDVLAFWHSRAMQANHRARAAECGLFHVRQEA